MRCASFNVLADAYISYSDYSHVDPDLLVSGARTDGIVQLIDSLDADVVGLQEAEVPLLLADMPPGAEIGKGSEATFKSLGQLMIGEENTFVGVKHARQTNRSLNSRFRLELAFISLLTTESPELTSYVPTFMNLLHVEDQSKATGILTEDASCGGLFSVEPQPTSQKAREMLYKPFAEYGTLDDIVDADHCDNALAFRAKGVERLLDFTPLPVFTTRVWRNMEYKAVRNAVQELTESLTITVPRDSVLGRGLVEE